MRRNARTWSGCRSRYARATRLVPFLMLAPFLGCLDFSAPSRFQQTAPAAEHSTTVRVTVVTSGAEIDPDGYVVEVETNPLYRGEMPQFQARNAVGTNGSVTFPVRMGWYVAHLSGVTRNCSIPAHVPVEVESAAPEEVLVTLTVECLAIPATQGVRLTTVTTGSYADTLRYSVILESDASSAGPRFNQRYMIGANETTTVPAPIGLFRIVLEGAAPSCAAFRAQWASVEPNQPTQVTFKVDCPTTDGGP